MDSAKYVIIDGCAIIFSAAIKHSDMVRHHQKVTGAGFVHFTTKVDSYGETIVIANAYGHSYSLGVESQEGDSALLTRQITNPY